MAVARITVRLCSVCEVRKCAPDKYTCSEECALLSIYRREWARYREWVRTPHVSSRYDGLVPSLTEAELASRIATRQQTVRGQVEAMRQRMKRARAAQTTRRLARASHASA